MKWSRHIKTSAAIIGAIAALGAWLLPQERFRKDQHKVRSHPPQIVTEPQIIRREVSQTSEAGTPEKKHVIQPSEGGASSRVAQKPRVISRVENVQEFTLSNGEQKILCSGLVGIAADFTTVSGVDLLSLRINEGEESTYHAILGAGERFKIICSGRDLYMSVTALDYFGQKASFRID